MKILRCRFRLFTPVIWSTSLLAVLLLACGTLATPTSVSPADTPAPTATQTASPLPETLPATATEAVPSAIVGLVDMSSAPPYLMDPIVHPDGMPAVVVFFNQDDGAWWWVHTTGTHPHYQMAVPPGDYLVAAYAQGVGDVPYVAAGYTAMNPSCGQELALVNVPPNTAVSGIDIADWNWSCGGTAYRPPKPDEAPLP